MRASDPRNRLQEILESVARVMPGIAIAATGVSAGIRAETYAEDRWLAADHADLLLARLESGELLLEDTAGTFAEDGTPQLSWQVEVTTTDVEGLQAATVTVRWTTHGVEREFAVERWFFVDPQAGER